MECPYCHKQLTFVTNSRPTKNNAQVWRRRYCENCKETFTTHEVIDLSHLVVIKKSGQAERFSQAKLYSGIYGATIGSKLPNREFVVDKITREVEKKILSLKKKKLASQEITDIVLEGLKKSSPTTFLRYLAYNKNPKSEVQIRKELSKYLKIKI
ncbi:MAG TPA: ATP cone domain-containing protein [Patescibacteria group bacterium]|nr:ATP cone domain-containing protein [Patescibacteria group bacterium]